MRFFNVAGPCIKDDHYMLNPIARIKGVEALIDMETYFVIHAARQSGKTTYLKAITDRLNADGRYYALYCSLEIMQGVTDPREGITEIVKAIRNRLLRTNIPSAETFAQNADYDNFTDVLLTELTSFCGRLTKPLVIFFDEADCLSEGTLITFLRQLRNGYNDRNSSPFVHSLALVGMRNIRDYKARIRPDSESLGSASPFNIVTKSLTLNNFTREEVAELYSQHTADTGQSFSEEAIDYIHEQTNGQPWLVNAVAHEIVFEILERDYSQTITPDMANTAIQNIILRRDAHIDSLLERLKETRVRKIIEPMLIGGSIESRLSDDYLYTRDLGLIKETADGMTVPANPIYAEVIVRTLTYDYQAEIRTKYKLYQMPRYMKDGSMDMDSLILDFQQFWRENSGIWQERFDYKEAAPHLIMMAFLQRVVNGGGQIIREVALDVDRLDLCVVYEKRKYPIEIKLRYGELTQTQGIEQLSGYMDTTGCREGWLCIFDRRKDLSWDDKIFIHKEIKNEKTITIAGL